MKTMLITFWLLSTCMSYASDYFVLKNDTVIPNQHRERPVTFPGPQPTYPGGEVQMMKDIHDNLVYPKLEKSKGIEGTAIVQFYVEMDGSISEIKVLRGIKNGENLNKAAVQAVKKLKNFIPDKNYDGVPIRIALNVPVHFKLSEETDVKPKK